MLNHRARSVTTLLFAAGLLSGCSAASNDGQGAPGTGGVAGFPTGGGGGNAAGGVTGAGGVGAGNVGSGNGGLIGQLPGHNPNDRDGGGCKSEVGKGELLPLDIFIMFDQSQSMDCATTTGNRWNAVKQALTGFVNDPGAAGIGVGIQFFGDNGLGSSCDAAAYSTPAVPIAPLPGNANAIIGALDSHRPSTNTPSRPALEGAIAHARTWKQQHPGHTVIVLFVTDGQPNACGDNGGDFVEPVVQVARAGLESPEKMNTYVIGIVSEGVACPFLDPAPPTKADLDRVAVSGGTTESFMVDVNQNASQKFLEATNKIRVGAQPPCEYRLPEPDKGTKLDPEFVNVTVTDQAGAPTTIFRVASSGVCNPSTGGWYYDNEAAPTKILLCPATCSGAGKIGSSVQLKFGCVRSQRPPA